MLRHVNTPRARVALVVTLVILLAGVVLDLLLSATPALSVGPLLAAALAITLVLSSRVAARNRRERGEIG
jgi:Flp pilus assembly protein TadB